VDVGDGADELGEDLLDFCGLEGTVREEVVVEFVAWAVLEDEPDVCFGDYDFVEAGYVRVDELAVVVDFAGEIRVVFVGGLEDDLAELC
jgi:hypothetical protein